MEQLKNFNNWANEFNVSSRYKTKTEPPSCNHFDVEVFKSMSNSGGIYLKIINLVKKFF